jgi:hypothetical protein
MIALGDMISVLVALAAGAASAAGIITSRRGVMIVALLVQFACAALLFSSLPKALVLAYWIVGACVCGILAATSAGPYGAGEAHHAGIPSGMWFRVVAVLLVALASMSLARAAIGTGDAVAPGVPVGAGLLVGLGLLQVGLSEEPLRVGSGLMSIISGFEIGYTTVETAIALHGLVIGVPLLIALVVAYLQVQQTAGSDTIQ